MKKEGFVYYSVSQKLTGWFSSELYCYRTIIFARFRKYGEMSTIVVLGTQILFSISLLYYKMFLGSSKALLWNWWLACYQSIMLVLFSDITAFPVFHNVVVHLDITAHFKIQKQQKSEMTARCHYRKLKIFYEFITIITLQCTT